MLWFLNDLANNKSFYYIIWVYRALTVSHCLPHYLG